MAQPQFPQPAWTSTVAAKRSLYAAVLRPALKRGFDLVGAAVLLLLTAPVFIVLALLVKLDGGPVLYGQARVGRDGRTFRCLKFRSMQPRAEQALDELLRRDPDAAAEWARTRKLRSDPRISRIGRWLRASSLDELPQLVNVLRGEMSLVGPRPVTAAELTEHYGAAAGDYISVRPGITGLWQVSGRNDTSYNERIALDLAYIRNPSLIADCRILLRTVPAVLLQRGAM